MNHCHAAFELGLHFGIARCGEAQPAELLVLLGERAATKCGGDASDKYQILLSHLRPPGGNAADRVARQIFGLLRSPTASPLPLPSGDFARLADSSAIKLHWLAVLGEGAGGRLWHFSDLGLCPVLVRKARE